MQEHHEDEGASLLSRISNEMVRAQKEYWGKGPVRAKSYMFDDMLFIVMRGGMTVAETTMLDFGHEDQVRHFRQTFENSMTGRLTGMIEELTDRQVVNYQSQILFDPDMVVEIFVFDTPAATPARAATAEGQVSDGQTGQATDEQALDRDPTSNQ